jgi:branched-chain amino acid transport system permease protein
MIRFSASLVGGLTLGGTLALIALGLVLAFRATRTFNFAHGELMLLPAFIVGYFQAHHVSLGLALPLTLLVSTLTGVLFYVLVLRRTTGLPLFMGIVATLGLASVLDGVMGILFGGNQYAIVLPEIPTGVTRIGGAGISQTTLALSGWTIGLAIIVIAIVRFTHLGLTIRAAGQDPVLASQCGINVRRVYTGSWAAVAVLAGIAGISYGSTTVVNTSMVGLGLVALPAIMLGGLDSIEGAVVGGLIIGLVQGFTQTYLGGQYVDVVTYSILLVVLLIHPEGLFGTKHVVRA